MQAKGRGRENSPSGRAPRELSQSPRALWESSQKIFWRQTWGRRPKVCLKKIFQHLQPFQCLYHTYDHRCGTIHTCGLMWVKIPRGPHGDCGSTSVCLLICTMYVCIYICMYSSVRLSFNVHLEEASVLGPGRAQLQVSRYCRSHNWLLPGNLCTLISTSLQCSGNKCKVPQPLAEHEQHDNFILKLFPRLPGLPFIIYFWLAHFQSVRYKNCHWKVFLIII